MKKTMLMLVVVLGLGAIPALATSYCVARATSCGDRVSLPVPAGGSCLAEDGPIVATVVVYDSAGNVVGGQATVCPIGPC